MTTTNERVIEDISRDALLPHPANRKHFDPKKLEELTASIRMAGIHTPLLVRPHPDGTPGRMQIIAGERRWMAAAKAGLEVVPCLVSDMTEDEAIEILLTENMQREDPHPLEEAEAYQAWLDLPGHDVRGLAARVGMSVAHVYSRLQLRQLSPAAKKIVWEGKLPIGHAQLLARLSPPLQEEALKEVERDTQHGGEVGTLERFADQVMQFDREIGDAPFPVKDADLLPQAGACVACPKRSGYEEGLFPELVTILKDQAPRGKKVLDTCFDAGCWKTKEKAYLSRQKKALKAEHGDQLVELSSRYGNAWPAKDGAPIPEGIWTKAEKKAKGAVPGLMMNGRQIGALLWVTLKPKPAAGAKTAPVKAQSSDSSDHEKREAKRKEKAAVELPRRSAVLHAILAKVPAKLDADLVREYVIDKLEEYDYDRNSLAQKLGLKVPKNLKGASDRELTAQLVLNAVDGELDEYAVDGPARKLLELAEHFGVNAKKVLADFDALVKAAAAKKLGDLVKHATAKAASKPKKKRAGDVARAKKAKKKAGAK